ncbi:DUF1217 domain-containing protein [Cognatishimia sp.]|uniref:DUF1217 domain-containing protein n=1 Tax=Cognatishimia sp. TaxID=2211648 RepID=UPI003517251C
MVISVSGLTSQAALNLIDRTRDTQMTTLRSEAQHQRAASVFRERIASITTPEELVKDFEVYSFVMNAFDLEDQIFGRGMMRKILESDPVDDSALVNRLSDSRFGEIHEALGFTTSGGTTVVPDFTDTDWQDSIVDRYFNVQFQNQYNDQNETVGTVMEFRDKVDGFNTWFNILSDRSMTEFFQTALGMPTQLSSLDIDKQAEMLEKRFSLEKLQDPREVEGLISRYMIIRDVRNPPAQATSAAIQILNNTSGQFVPFTLDIEAVNFSGASLFR